MIALRILGWLVGGLVGIGVVIGIAGTLLILRRFLADGLKAAQALPRPAATEQTDTVEAGGKRYVVRYTAEGRPIH